MKKLSSRWNRGLSLLGVCGIGALLAGCGSGPSEEPVFSSSPVASVGSPAAVTPGAAPERPSVATISSDAVGVGRFRIGDMVTVTFSGIEPPPQPHEERIKEDGTVTLPMIGSVIAKGKTAGELQKEIQSSYVPKYYLRLTVTVKGSESFFTVGGEVKMPSRLPWAGELTVTQAIQSAGDFTDFANRKKVIVIRANGNRVPVDCIKALRDPSLDPKVLPGDKITVPRRWW